MTSLKIMVYSAVILLFAPILVAAQESSSGPAFVALDDGVAVAQVRPAKQPPQTNASSDVENRETDPVGQLKSCVYRSGGAQYQAVKFKMKRAASVRLDALLYDGSGCSPSQFIDEFGYGNKVSLGKGIWIFWFIHFPDMLDTSGLWKVGKQRSQCADYRTAPDC